MALNINRTSAPDLSINILIYWFKICLQVTYACNSALTDHHNALPYIFHSSNLLCFQDIRDSDLFPDHRIHLHKDMVCKILQES